MQVVATDNPWADRFTSYLAPEALKALLDYRPAPASGLDQVTLHEAKVRIEAALEELFVATEPRVAIALAIVEAMHAWSLRTYSTRRNFVELLYHDLPDIDPDHPIVLTGLAGVGKSALVKRLLNILPKHMEVFVDHDPGRFPLLWGLRITTGANRSVLYLLKSLRLPGLPVANRNIDYVCKEIRRRAFRCGISLIVPDELQFYTKSKSATAKITTLLYTIQGLGIPVLASMNYSLCHRLMDGRNQEDLDRFFSRVLQLQPPGPASSDWIESIQARIDLAPGVFAFKAKEVARELFEYTFGLDRYLNRLLVLAYVSQRSRNQRTVSISDIKAAYLSGSFASDRKNVLALFNQRIRGKFDRKRLDLINPFPDENKTGKEEEDIVGDIAREQSAELTMRDLVDQNMTYPERQEQKRIARAQKAEGAKANGGKVVPISEGRSRSVATGKDALGALLKSMKLKDN